MAGHSSSGHETYYVPEQSKLAICTAFGLFLSVYGAARVINDAHYHAGEPTNASFFLFAGLAFFIGTLAAWFRTTIKENLAGINSAQLKHSYIIGMQWFIFSEVMFFLAFFGALFYVRVLAGPWLASMGAHPENYRLWGDFKYQWPLMETPQQAVGIANQYMANNGTFAGPHENLSFPGWNNLAHWLPLWNTIVLLSSSFTVHIAHMGIKEGNRAKLKLWLGITVLLGLTFVFLQYNEYHEAFKELGLTLKSGIYGTTFFMLTGFHGFHVIMGATILLVQFLRASVAGHFTAEDQFGFEAASWYWHFVDVVWVGLFLFVYIL
ncbi:MAG TPA: cytochrome c oxidase subunit 3 [Spongiibacteraceae bacterium]|nr:cytochrome c oxidase subunit 3 [Spongiibacteraceae bacterium]